MNGLYKIILIWVFFCANVYAEESLELKETYSIQPIPSWVTQQEIPKNIGQDGNYGVSYYLLERQLDFGTESQDYFRLVYSIDQKEALAENSQVIIDYNPSFQKLEVHHINVIRNGKVVNRITLNDITVAQSEDTEESLMLTGKATASTQIKGLQVNDIVDFSYTIKGQNPVFEGKTFFRQNLGWSSPIKKLFVNTTSDKALQIKATAYHDKLSRAKVSGRYNYRLSVDNVSTKKSLDGIPNRILYFPYIQGSEFESWDEVVEWALPHYQDKFQLNSSLIDIVKGWKKKYPDDLESQVTAAIQYVQDDIRYFGIELGVNSHKPHHPNTVFDRKYGDCKDKTVMLVALLNQLGVTAYPALVSTDLNSGFEKMLPSPGVFDHVIVGIKYDDKYYFVDPTKSAQRGSLKSMSLLPYEKVLIIDSQLEQGIVEIPQHRYDHRIHIEEEFKWSTMSEPASYLISSTYYGVEADRIRSWYKVNSESVIQDNYFNFYKKVYPTLKINDGIDISDDEELNIVTIKESYLVPSLWNFSSNHYYSDFSSYEMKSHIYYPERPERKAALAIPFPKDVTHHIKVELPNTFTLDTEKDTKKISHEDFSFKRSVAIQKNSMDLSFDYKVHDKEVDVEKLPSYYESLLELQNNLNYRLVFPANKSQQKQQRKKRLQDLIKG